jgi:hypothetical protein
MRRYFRAYPAISSRQQGADRLVYSEDDLRRVLWQAVDPKFEGERPSTIRLAADIYLSRPIELGVYDYNVSIEGSDRYSIAHIKNYSGEQYLFGLPSGTISNLTFDGITFEVAGQLYSIFGGSNGGTASEFALYDCFTKNQNFAYTTTVFDSTVNAKGCDINAAAAFGFMSIGGASFGGTVTYATPAIGGTPTFEQKSTFGDIFSRGVSGVVCGNGATDISLTVDGGLELKKHEHNTLTGSDPLVTVGNRSFISVTCDSTTSNYIRLGYGQGEGQILHLLFRYVDPGSTVKVDDIPATTTPYVSAEIQINKNFHSKKPTSGEIISFIYASYYNLSASSYRFAWIEISRSENQ